MNKLFAFFAFCFVCCSLLCGFVEGLAGVNVTALTDDIDAEAIIIPVKTTEGFAGASHPDDSRYIIIGGESIFYAGKTDTSFVMAERGMDNPRTNRPSTASSHSEGSKVMNPSSGAMNDLVGGVMFASSQASFGSFIAIVAPGGPFWPALWQMLMWDYSFFTGQLVIIRILLIVVLSGGFIFTIIMAMLTLAQGLFRL